MCMWCSALLTGSCCQLPGQLRKLRLAAGPPPGKRSVWAWRALPLANTANTSALRWLALLTASLCIADLWRCSSDTFCFSRIMDCRVRSPRKTRVIALFDIKMIINDISINQVSIQFCFLLYSQQVCKGFFSGGKKRHRRPRWLSFFTVRLSDLACTSQKLPLEDTEVYPKPLSPHGTK